MSDGGVASTGRGVALLAALALTGCAAITVVAPDGSRVTVQTVGTGNRTVSVTAAGAVRIEHRDVAATVQALSEGAAEGAVRGLKGGL